jgi:hypothetical protein
VLVEILHDGYEHSVIDHRLIDETLGSHGQFQALVEGFATIGICLARGICRAAVCVGTLRYFC